MKRTLMVAAVMAALPALAFGAPMLMLTYGGTGTTPNTNTTTTEIPAPGGTGTGINFWLNVVLLNDEGNVGAFGAGLDVNAAGSGLLKYMAAVQSSYTYYDDELGEDVTASYWDRVTEINSTSTGYIGDRKVDETDGTITLVNIGLYSAMSESGAAVNPPAGAFPIVESIRVRLYNLNPTEPIVISFVNPGGGLNWGCMAASAADPENVPAGDFSPSQLGTFTILPEPATLALLGVGCVLIMQRRVR